MQKDKGLPDRETGNWSGNQDKKPRPGNEDGKQMGQREYTDPAPADKSYR